MQYTVIVIDSFHLNATITSIMTNYNIIHTTSFTWKNLAKYQPKTDLDYG